MQEILQKEALNKGIELLTKLPDKSFLELAKTQQQLQRWHNIRVHNWLLVWCWKARINGYDDPLAEYVESGELQQWEYELIWLTVDYWELFWGLCQLGERYLKKDAKKEKIDYPFKSARELFEHIVSRDINTIYSECLKPYSTEYSVKKLKKMSELWVKKKHQGDLNPIEEKNLEVLIDRYVRPEENPWKNLLIICCKENAKRNYALRTKLESFDNNIVSCSMLMRTLIRRRDSSSYNKPKSWVWKHGEKFTGNSRGTYS